MSRNPLEGFGLRLRAARDAKGWSQHELANHVGVRPLAISQAERGAATPRPETIVACASALGVELAWLMTGDGTPPHVPDPVSADA